MIKIGVTGTRSGLTDNQIRNVFGFIKSLIVKYGSVELHHGDCVGADEHVARMAKSLGCRIVCHPPIKDELRAFFEYDECRDPMSYFARNRNIVNETRGLIVVPFQNEWQSFGGTWYTHDYAVKVKKPVKIFYPG